MNELIELLEAALKKGIVVEPVIKYRTRTAAWRIRLETDDEGEAEQEQPIQGKSW